MENKTIIQMNALLVSLRQKYKEIEELKEALKKKDCMLQRFKCDTTHMKELAREYGNIIHKITQGRVKIKENKRRSYKERYNALDTLIIDHPLTANTTRFVTPLRKEKDEDK